MSSGELRRVEVMGRVRGKTLKVLDAAQMLELSYRQTKRLWQRYRQEGAQGLKHRSAGKISNRAKPEKFRGNVLRMIREKYSGTEQRRFGPTLAAEHLAEEDGLQVNGETLRRWMLAEGLWSRSRRRKAHRKRRERKQHFGELVQLDGSFHEWFEERGPRGCLMNMVDDATGKTMCRMGEQETIWAAVGVLRGWIGKYGVPQALYTDWKNVYKRQPSERERLRGQAPTTQFGRMCERLGIRIIAASSPQAKGRVERNNGVHQDRLVKKLRRQGIQSYQATNEYLEAEYLPEHNGRFVREAAEAEDYHGKAPSPSRLQEIFRFETERWVSNDWVIQYRGRHLQLQPRSRRYGPTRAKALVCQWEDGGIEVRYRGQRHEFKELVPSRQQEKEQPNPQKTVIRSYGRKKPANDHPWRQGYDKSLLPRENRAENFALVGVSASAAP
ncbi:MAG TPA: ISNCY family transposase [Candidatus Dormibacteraeota bacterium]|nr:ISNCY family transposase [Candidatus Dormibacteraeota bacterium]